MRITFDPAKDASNQEKHGVSLAEAARLDWDGMVVVQDMRARVRRGSVQGHCAVRGRLYSVVFTPRDETMRIISLHKASNTEIDAYEQS